MTAKTIYQQIHDSKTAQNAQDIAQEHIDLQLKSIKTRVAAYKKVKNPDWCHVGDQTRVIELLDEIESFLRNDG